MGVGDATHAHELPDDILMLGKTAMEYTPNDVRVNSPQSLSFVELRTQRDLDIFRKLYAHSFRIGDTPDGWKMSYAREFDMTTDSKYFHPREWWESRGYSSDSFGRWINSTGDIALPLFQGAMVHHFDPAFQSFESKGTGQTRLWVANRTDDLRFSPQYLMDGNKVAESAATRSSLRFGFRDVVKNTNERTFVGSLIPFFPSGNTLPILTLDVYSFHKLALLSASASSLACDYSARIRLNGTHMNLFVLEDIPIPRCDEGSRLIARISHSTAALTLVHRLFAPEWLKLKHLEPDYAGREWKHWWAVTEADRLRLRVEIDALVADLYGLDPDDFDWIVRDDPKDPKGFYRVDRQLPFQERLTGLASAAFRALKEGKWSAESAANLSNDEFFDLLGIPELTNAKAAKDKGESSPLVLKRDGCHVWKPENFPADDPRHGWTWDDCWKDAVALLGSEDAVRKYIESEPNTPEEAPKYTGPRDLLGDPIIEKPKQKKLF